MRRGSASDRGWSMTTIQIQDLEGGVRQITLSRPPANAINGALSRALLAAVEAANVDSAVRAVIVRGNDRFFSGGLDLPEMAQGAAAEMAGFGYRDGAHALWTIPKPTVAEIAGHAIAGGALLALSCDVRIAARKTQKIGLNETAIGLAFPRGAYEIARSALANQHFGRLLLEAGLYGVEEAQRYGYVHEIVEAEALSARCLEVARTLAAHPREAYALNKQRIREPFVAACEGETVLMRERVLKSWGSEETQQAFLRRAATLTKK